MRYFYSIVLVILLGASQIPKSYSQVSLTPEPKIIDSEKKDWMALYKKPLGSNTPVACMIEIPGRTAYLRSIGTQSVRHGGNEHWSKKALDKVWGSGMRVDAKTYYYYLQTNSVPKEAADYRIETKFEKQELFSYKISSAQVPRPCWINIHEEY